ncbi:FAD-dependent oxidoreductase [Succinimonas amylolytica]|uniref:FAD-dependent oxidoreductase n=1 Tax=Succinimonas amylolytica TaxID=83769 RepID=UPI0003721508|nr:FAD-dependent oxidoreductase [Succinimonas amylolytica]
MEADKNMYDAVIIGGGPAGLSAALYAARAKYRVLVVEKAEIGGQITITSEVVNYPGVERASGRSLTAVMRKQALSFGAEFLAAEVTGFSCDGDIKTVQTSRGDFRALGIIVATGANPRRIGFTGEQEFQGRGVAYCATCDGEFFAGKEVLVVGGGFAAVEESMFLTRYASHITILVRKDSFSCAKTVSDHLKDFSNITVLFNTELQEVSGSGLVEKAVLKNNVTGETREFRARDGGNFGVFVFAGYVPATGWLPPEIARDEAGYVITDENRKTSVDGVYAAGDLCVKNLRQVVTAVADGAIAATSLEKSAQELHQKYDLPDLTVFNENAPRPAEAARDEAPSGSASREDSESGTAGTPGGLLTPEIRAQLKGVFGKLTSRVTVRLWPDGSSLSEAMKAFLEELRGLSDSVVPEIAAGPAPEGLLLPSFEIAGEHSQNSNIHFHGVPGGHELNSFVIAIYNTGSAGQALDPAVKADIAAVDHPVTIRVMVSLSCTMCPETVMSAQRAASLNPLIRAEMIDLAHFPALKERYSVMSVPCTVISGKDGEIRPVFGKKNLAEIAALLKTV